MRAVRPHEERFPRRRAGGLVERAVGTSRVSVWPEITASSDKRLGTELMQPCAQRRRSVRRDEQDLRSRERATSGNHSAGSGDQLGELPDLVAAHRRERHRDEDDKPRSGRRAGNCARPTVMVDKRYRSERLREFAHDQGLSDFDDRLCALQQGFASTCVCIAQTIDRLAGGLRVITWRAP